MTKAPAPITGGISCPPFDAAASTPAAKRGEIPERIIIGIVILGLGIGFYLIANLGPGARDGLMTGTQKITKLSFSLTRTLIEFSVLAMGWYLGGIVGIGTVIYALGIGPFVSASFFFVGKYVK